MRSSTERTDGARRRIRLQSRTLGVGFLSALLSGLLAFGGVAAPAHAATVYEIAGEWDASTPIPPATVAKGDVVNAVWRVNVNSDLPAPTNDPVDNVMFSVTLEHGLFKALPDACLATGVTPASALSADSRTLTCNLGTKDEGTAVVVGTPVVVDGLTGDKLTAVGTIDGKTAALPALDVKNTFGMDMNFGDGNTAGVYWNGTTTNVTVDFQWSLRVRPGSDPGPDTATYRLTMTSANGAPVSTGTARPSGEIGCSPFNYNTATGHPWSGLPGYGSPDQKASFVQSCTLTPVSGQPGKFDLTLTGINYDLLLNPTRDSNGNALPTDWNYVASGSLWFTVTTSAAGSLSLSSNAPSYTSTTGLTSADLPGNNTSSRAYTLPGSWAGSWVRGFTGSGGTQWDDTYRVAAGTTVQQIGGNSFSAEAVAASAQYGQCLALDTKYVTYVPGSTVTLAYSKDKNKSTVITTPKFEYYVGASAVLDPASGSYNPDQFDCAGAAGWTTVEPANPAQVRAVRSTYPYSTFAANGASTVNLTVKTAVKLGAPNGQDVWMFDSVLRNGTWIGPARNDVLTPTAGARYPNTNGRRDILRIVAATPSIKKSADRAVVKPGEPATFTLTYAANTVTPTLPTVNNYKIVDTLPIGATYVPGSATPAPVITTTGTAPNQQQVLTWTLNGVSTNVEHALTYQADVAGSVKPGTVLTNTVTSSVSGVTSPTAEAQVTLTTSGYTTIVKTADAPYIPNTAGDGKGAGSWTVTIRSYDPVAQKFTDAIDILPYVGDGRGTAYSGSYTLTAVTPPAGATVYYTTVDPATLSDDPSTPANGSAGSVSGNTVGWATTYTPNATAIRVIGGALAPGATSAFKVKIATDGATGGDTLVNRAQGIAQNTRLVMRTSEPISIANYYSAALKKYVQDRAGNWHDANDAVDYPTFRAGDTVKYRIVIENTGKGTLTNLIIKDDKFTGGDFTVAELKPGAQEAHEYTVELTGDLTKNRTIVNTACATADTPVDAAAPTINCDPAGIEIVGAVSWAKVDNGGHALSGAEWKLAGPTGATSADVTVTDCIAATASACTGIDTDQRAGHFTVDDLAWGEYVLVETKAPAGYVLDATPHKITVDRGSVIDLGEIVNRQQAALQIPLTGGTGTILFTGGGILLLGALGVLLWIRARRRTADHTVVDA